MAKSGVLPLGLGSMVLMSFTKANTSGSSQPYMDKHYFKR